MVESYFSRHKQTINTQILELINKEEIPMQLKKSMNYSIEIGGKRLRPILLFAVLEAFGQEITKGYKTAAALEMIHTYSLIHDDLPAMDNDDLRRGRPTNHKVFGEATAILAGDGLLTHAFNIISRDETLSVQQRLQLVQRLSAAAGPMGMIAGQMQDMEAENNQITLDQLKEIHYYKTGCLIEFAIVAGAIIGQARDSVLDKLRKFAYHLGIAFQIKDDILDIEGDTELIGKNIGSDLLNEKSTYVTLTSLEEAKKLLENEIQMALAILDELSINSQVLKEITLFVQNRQK